MNEIIRVISVIEKALESNGTGWLVGNKCSYADISFVTWAEVGSGLLKQLGELEDQQKKFPRYVNWIKALDSMSSVATVKKKMAEGRTAHGLP